tara:strand:- start:328 stop:429 length:102 start_codon:yes stop_codon:yes gene_type:complete
MEELYIAVEFDERAVRALHSAASSIGDNWACTH